MTHLAAAIQMTSGSDKAANLEKAEHLIRLAAARGAKFVALPEVFNWRGKRTEEPAAAESLEGATLTLMAGLARELEIHLLPGSITEHVPGESRRYNTSVLIGPEGETLASYRKIHLFDIDVPGLEHLKESKAVKRGESVVVAESPAGRIGLSICYDVRFPELYRRLTREGARVLAIPSAFTDRTGRTIGRSSCVRAPSRTWPTCSHPRRPAITARAAPRTATR